MGDPLPSLVFPCVHATSLSSPSLAWYCASGSPEMDIAIAVPASYRARLGLVIGLLHQWVGVRRCPDASAMVSGGSAPAPSLRY